ncbi:MAG: RidA family protein [Pseudolabrys sp.]
MADGRHRVRPLKPGGAITPTGPWSLGARAGDFVFIAGMRGIDPATNKLVDGDEARVRQAFRNMQLIAASEGAALTDCVRLTVFVTDMGRLRPVANAVQEELWSGGPYPPRTIVEVAGLNQDDIFEVEGTFYAPLTR